jgi:membrane associated rhomboid family serine protease
MANCPTCDVPLQTVRQREGVYFYCDQCNGRAATVAQIRRMTGDRFASRLVRKINTATEVSSRSCPFCLAPMKLVQLSQPEITLDSCRPCVTVWFDAGKFEELPEGVIESSETILARGLEAEAKWKMEEAEKRERQSGSIAGEAPEEGWKWIPALIGLPVKIDNTDTSCLPWATWSLAVVITIVSVCAFFDLQDAVNNFGLIPAEAFRYGGITFLTSFFLHGGIWHLVSNLYFFLLFAGNVEDYLGRWRFLGLIFLSDLVGNIFHIALNAHSMEPCVGASGGISGVLVFYALQFPRAKLAFLFRFYWRFAWVHIPAWVAFVVWLLLQLFGVYDQLKGFSNVSSLAHLGGVTTGFVLWLYWRKIGLKNVEREEE